jgi:pimeloyl-ACP methyl ester carboxylesterase
VKSLLLVHGAGSGPWVFDCWPERFPGVRVEAVDLHRRLEIAFASMRDYAAAVERALEGLPRPLGLAGWSMGGLVAMTVADLVDRLILLEPSPPGEVQGFHPELALVYGSFDPERIYGAFPDGVGKRSESALARGERKRGISVPSLPCPTLVVYGDWAERGCDVARHYGADELHLPGKSHWDLVLDPEAVEAIAYRSRSTG